MPSIKDDSTVEGVTPRRSGTIKVKLHKSNKNGETWGQQRHASSDNRQETRIRDSRIIKAGIEAKNNGR